MTGRFLLALLLVLASAAAPGRSGPAPADPPAIAAQIAVTAGFSALDERSRCDEGSAKLLFLSVQNQGATPLVVRGVRLLAPSDLVLCPRTDGGDIRVEGGRRSVVPLRVAVVGVPRQGATPLILEVTLAANVGGAERVDTLLAAQNVEIRIPGLSDALKLLGVPTLLLLPGVLTLTALFLFFTPATGGRWAKIAPPGSGFWMVAVPASFALSWAYAGAMSAAGFPRDLSERFGLWDIGMIWVGSMLLGGIAGWALEGWKRRREDADLTLVAARTLSADDEPLALFERLLRIGGYERAPEYYSVPGRSGFLIRPRNQPRWLIPQAVPIKTAPAGIDKTRWDDALAALSALIVRNANLSELVAFLRERHLAGLDLVAWPGGLRPLELAQTDEPKPEARRYFVAGL